MDSLVERLNRARAGGAILFCGAGFSADCLNFKPRETLGTGAQLLAMCNEVLEQYPPFAKLQNAADALWDKLGDNGMEKLLKERFTVADVTTDMTDLLRYPWQAVYTTNYDNAIEQAAQAARRSAEGLSNTDDPSVQINALPIIHLHGYVGKWNIHNIRESCVLGAESYQRLSLVKQWLDRFRLDVDMAQIVVFVGFNAGDFHLNQAIYDLTGLREKAFFINRPTAAADPDVAAEQKRLGTPLYVGRAGLADTITDLLKKEAPHEPRLASFAAIRSVAPASQVPTAREIEDLFLYGQVVPEQLARDISNGLCCTNRLTVGLPLLPDRLILRPS
ncbi:SIR2 family protein [Albidovulum sp.]|uniref:SIR2 family protein n=1 Tax=Albidovulum sp. TaxID=1872424 RepID=UPI0025BE3677|nr:SIR2 family protein [Defluviimonas sp.]